MLRSVLVLLLLCNYLLVVGAGMVGRPEPPRYSAAHPYVHSATCQQQNYLRLDCFGTCHGDQHALEKNTKPLTPQQVISLAKAIDLHCLHAPVLLPTRPTVGPAPAYAGLPGPRVAVGFAGVPDFPPRRG